MRAAEEAAVVLNDSYFIIYTHDRRNLRYKLITSTWSSCIVIIGCVLCAQP